MKYADYRRWTERATEWIEAYFAGLRSRPVRAATRPGEIAARLPEAPPEEPEPMDAILDDFARLVPDGMTHWQHPRFFAYFPANAAPASMIAEQLANAMAAQCMLWQTSPAATEMEQVVTGWLARALGLPETYSGVIHDSASSATLAAVLTIRERATGFAANETGLAGGPRLRIYASEETHSSVDKAARIAGIGQHNLVKVETDPETLAMRPEALAAAIAADRAARHVPAGLVLCIGGTATGACDHMPPLLDIAEREGLYTHVDAAWAGSAMICPEFRPIWEGVERADSVVVNPHKWLGAQFDCSVQFLRAPDLQRRTMGLRPSYLETPQAREVVNFSEWTVPLGRRFRALKLWFVLRAYGLSGLREMIRNHVAWTAALAERLRAHPDFEIVTEPRLALFTFRWRPEGEDPDRATARLLAAINDDGRIYLTQTEHRGRYLIRFTAGQFECTEEDVRTAGDAILEIASRLS